MVNNVNNRGEAAPCWLSQPQIGLPSRDHNWPRMHQADVSKLPSTASTFFISRCSCCCLYEHHQPTIFIVMVVHRKILKPREMVSRSALAYLHIRWNDLPFLLVEKISPKKLETRQKFGKLRKDSTTRF